MTSPQTRSSPLVLPIALLSTCVILMFADQNLMAPNLSQIAQEFGMDEIVRDTKLGGDISLAFWLLGAPASIIMGCLTDIVRHRIRWLSGIVLLGELGCLGTYFCHNYSQLYVCRALTGISMGGALPVIYSVSADLYPPQQRHQVNSVLSMGMGVGASMGQGLAGFLGPTFGWKLPFLLVSLPAIFVALCTSVVVPEPIRGGAETFLFVDGGLTNASESSTKIHQGEWQPLELESPKSGQRTSSMTDADDPTRTFGDVETRTSWKAVLLGQYQTLKVLLSTPTLVLALLQGAPGCVPWGIVTVYLTDYLAINQNMSVEYATLIMLIFGVGNFIGMMIGGQGGAYLYKRHPKYPSLLAGLSSILACLPFWYLLNFVDDTTNLVFVSAPVSLLAGTLSGITGPIIKATLQNVTLPQMRGQAFAWFNTFDDFGRGLGPVFCAKLIAHFSRRRAFNMGTIGWMFCGVANLGVYCTVEKDERAVQESLNAASAVPVIDMDDPTLSMDGWAVT